VESVLADGAKYAWYRELTRYHWFVLSVASMGWMFDTMAQQLFNLARKPAIRELLGGGASNAVVDKQAAWATAIFMVGWAIGGVFFGVLGDRLGRAKTMMITILSYTVFTGLSVFSTGVWEGSSASGWRWWRRWCRRGPGPMHWGWCRPRRQSAT
jgi:MFS family permease